MIDPHGDHTCALTLRVVSRAGGVTVVAWTQVDDGTGNPAWYRLKHARKITSWRDAHIGCDRTMEGDEIGAEMTCSFSSDFYFDASTFEVRLMSFRVEDGLWHDAHFSNVAVPPPE